MGASGLVAGVVCVWLCVWCSHHLTCAACVCCGQGYYTHAPAPSASRQSTGHAGWGWWRRWGWRHRLDGIHRRHQGWAAHACAGRVRCYAAGKLGTTRYVHYGCRRKRRWRWVWGPRRSTTATGTCVLPRTLTRRRPLVTHSLCATTQMLELGPPMRFGMKRTGSGGGIASRAPGSLPIMTVRPTAAAKVVSTRTAPSRYGAAASGGRDRAVVAAGQHGKRVVSAGTCYICSVVRQRRQAARVMRRRVRRQARHAKVAPPLPSGDLHTVSVSSAATTQTAPRWSSSSSSSSSSDSSSSGGSDGDSDGGAGGEREAGAPAPPDVDGGSTAECVVHPRKRSHRLPRSAVLQFCAVCEDHAVCGHHLRLLLKSKRARLLDVMQDDHTLVECPIPHASRALKSERVRIHG